MATAAESAKDLTSLKCSRVHDPDSLLLTESNPARLSDATSGIQIQDRAPPKAGRSRHSNSFLVPRVSVGRRTSAATQTHGLRESDRCSLLCPSRYPSVGVL